MPISKASYKRGYEHTIGRGREKTIRCEYCGREVPRYKTFTIRKGIRISDPTILKQVDRRMIHLMERIVRICPACARFRGISQPGKFFGRRRIG